MLLRSLLVLLIFISYPPVSYSQWYKQYWKIMGTRVGVELWHQDDILANKAIQEVRIEMERINKSMSPFIKTSEISAINRSASKHPVKISLELFSLIQEAQEISAQSNGTFDITFASVGYLYNYREKQHPSNKTIKQKLDRINYKNIKLFPKTLEILFKKTEVKIDLGGIAKGHAVDKSIDILKRLGIRHAVVVAGGDSRLLGDKNGKPWITGIRHPRNEGKYVAILPLDNTAVSTSGDYERFFIEDNIRYHHIIQPKTGLSAKNSQSVTIIGPKATRTDALSTTLFILPTQQALQLINRITDYEAIIIDKHGKMHYSKGLETPPKY